MPLDVTNANASPTGDNPFAKYNTSNSPILFPVGERVVAWKTRSDGYEDLKSHKAIVRVHPNGNQAVVLSVVGSGYKLVHNRDLFGHVEQTICNKMQPSELDGVIVKDKVSGWGRMCFREYLFPKIKCTVGRTGNTRSEVSFRMLVQNGYGGSALRVHAGAIDWYCTNGMISGEHVSTYNKHTSGLVVTGVGAAVEQALAAFADSQNRWKKWANTPVTHVAAMELFKELAATNKLQENLSAQYLREREVRGPNLWAVYSTLTYYASHHDGDFKLYSSVNEQDSVANTMLKRELSVAKWIETPQWHKMETV